MDFFFFTFLIAETAMKATKKHPISKFRKGTLGKPKPSSGEGKLCAILLAERHTHLNGKSLN